jgi:stearoyl-CoA desaturase (delta-9 desaturase)
MPVDSRKELHNVMNLLAFDGLVGLPWWGCAGLVLVFTHLTIVGVTVYLHRHQAHRALNLHPAVGHFFRFWLWLTTGMSTRAWTAVHRKHHAFVEQPADPHSPQVHGLYKVLTQGAELYRAEAMNPATLAKYGHGTPDDWLERRVYARHGVLGIALMLFTNVLLFGPLGLTMWAVQMIWIPLFAAGVINGLGHWAGYRNFETRDSSTNLLPWGILIGGEELHNNHHAFASSAKFALRPWEFDIGWVYIRILELCGLAEVRKVAQPPVVDSPRPSVDLDTVRAVVASHVHVLADYARRVVHPVHREEVARAGDAVAREAIRPLKRLIYRAELLLGEHDRARLSRGLAQSDTLATVYQFQRRLSALFSERQATQERLLQSLQEWCHQAEQTGIAALEDFAQRLRGYRLAN